MILFIPSGENNFFGGRHFYSYLSPPGKTIPLVAGISTRAIHIYPLRGKQFLRGPAFPRAIHIYPLRGLQFLRGPAFPQGLFMFIPFGDYNFFGGRHFCKGYSHLSPSGITISSAAGISIHIYPLRGLQFLRGPAFLQRLFTFVPDGTTNDQRPMTNDQ